MTTVIFPGTFDPWTLGHKEIAIRASKLFDTVIVLVSSNPEKSPVHSSGTRIQLIENSISDYSNIRVEKSKFRMLVDDLKDLECDVVVKGIRNSEDLKYEQDMYYHNAYMCPTLENVYLYSKHEYEHYSSSSYKTLVKLGADPFHMVDAEIHTSYTTAMEL